MKTRSFFYEIVEVEVVLCIVVRDSANYLVKTVVILRILAVLYPGADDVTHNTSEVLVSGVGEEAS